MQLLQITNNTTLKELSSQVGERNVDNILQINGLKRTNKIGELFYNIVQDIIDSTSAISAQRKVSIINTLTSDSDIFELAALSDNSSWKVLSTINTFPTMLRIPETITLPGSVIMYGNGEPVPRNIYDSVIDLMLRYPHIVDPSLFNEYSVRSSVPANILEGTTNETLTAFQWLRLPWGKISLFSSLSNASVDFPVYPEEIEDSRTANYDTMPDMLYQYEPWQVYKSSGPRSNTYTFKMHRDMWTGDHRDGKCNELIRFCEANCYPHYSGAMVHTSICTLYIAGKPVISGVITDVSTNWSGPIGLDGFYLVAELRLSITEVSKTKLNYLSVMNKGLID